MKRSIAAPAIFLFLLAGCVTPEPPHPGRLRPKVQTTPAKPAPATAPKTEAPGKSVLEQLPVGQPKSNVVFLAVNPNGDAAKLVNILKNNPALKLNLIFPPHYFDLEPHRSSIADFALLQSSKQIEVALNLENDPILPLLGDLDLAGDKVSKWGFTFQWPDDIAAQIARASGKYQKRWGLLPAGFYPPHQALSEQVMDTLKKFRVNWVIGKPQPTWGVRFTGATALIVPPALPFNPSGLADDPSWYDQLTTWTLGNPIVWIDATLFTDPKSELTYLDALVKKMAKAEHPASFVLGQPFIAALRDEYALAREFNPFIYDYSEWVSTPQQKRAWSALASARQVTSGYQRSGRANLQRLDAAVEEMCNVESGEFLLSLGQDNTGNSFNERNFLATLSNIYRLCETPVPPNINTWFANRTWQKTAVKTAENDRPFFVEAFQNLTWNDPKGDDNGSGKITYPTGNYPKGLFDLRELTVTWTDTDVTFSVGVMAPVGGKAMNVVPLVDVYIDVNRLPGAGSTTPLQKRGNALIARDAAWEYALAITPGIGFLYQAVPGSNPRVLEMKNVDVQTTNFSATFSRKSLRGDPKRWRLSVGLMGTENSRRKEEPLPVSILATAAERNFGGAAYGRQAPFIDLLTPTADDQTSRFTANESGGPLTLPYVEPQ